MKEQRNDFRTMLLWNPIVRTNNQESDPPFSNFDTLSVFRVTAEGFGNRLLVMARILFRTIQPLSISMFPPNLFVLAMNYISLYSLEMKQQKNKI